MITEQELFEIGFRRYGDEENDPYYKCVLKGDVFGIHFLSGNLNSNGIFEIYSMHNRKFSKISEIDDIFRINRFVIDWDVVNRYGSAVPLNGR